MTPSLFEAAPTGSRDEYTWTKNYGKDAAQQILEGHYSSFYAEQDFQDIAAAGLNFVRIPGTVSGAFLWI